MERLCFMRYSSNIAQTIYVNFTDRLHVGEEVNCVGEMFDIMSDQNVKLAGHIQNLVGQCPMTDSYFQL